MTWARVYFRTNWPDPGLSRNTRCRCYRCSVPGLAGFTRLALCGARDLIKFSMTGLMPVLAERVGFEPTERFPVHSISSAASSTTPAPLLEQPQKHKVTKIFLSFMCLFVAKNLWRRGWDSNPRWPLSHSGFRDRCTNPLCDLSASGKTPASARDTPLPTLPR